MAKLSLGTRLFLSHLLVMVVGLTTFILIGKLSSPQIFVLHLEKLEQKGLLTVKSARTYLINDFKNAWDTSTVWSVLVGASAAGGLSYWLSRRIMSPLNQMKKITQKFSSGDLQERMPEIEIPELNQLGISFNRMVSSLQDVEHRRRELIGDVTHELRTPLTVIRGYLEELADGSLEISPELYHRLIKETRRLERLITDLQELSKAESGYLFVDLQSFNLRTLLKSLVERFSDQLLEEGPTLDLDSPIDLPLVWADADRTEQILVNLLGNAIRYTEEGNITLKAWSDPEYVWVGIEDTGIGISPEDLPYIFDRFWRSESARYRHSGGTGIGLAIARTLVELQGGVLLVESEQGVGSIFSFCLPKAKIHL